MEQPKNVFKSPESHTSKSPMWHYALQFRKNLHIRHSTHSFTSLSKNTRSVYLKWSVCLVPWVFTSQQPWGQKWRNCWHEMRAWSELMILMFLFGGLPTRLWTYGFHHRRHLNRIGEISKLMSARIPFHPQHVWLPEQCTADANVHLVAKWQIFTNPRSGFLKGVNQQLKKAYALTFGVVKSELFTNARNDFLNDVYMHTHTAGKCILSRRYRS